MRRIEISKSGWIRSARIDFCKEGVFRGALMAMIEMSNSAKGSFDNVAEIVQALLDAPMPTNKLVRFSGSFAGDDANLLLLIKSLSDYGFKVQCIIDGTQVYPWMSYVSWIIVKTTGTIVMTISDEVWIVCDKLPEKDIPIPGRAGKFTYCYLSGRLDMDEVDNFMCQSKQIWAIL